MTARNELPRHDKMVAAAVWLAGQGFADIGWAPASDGKAPNRPWKSDATDDPALVPDRLHGARNALVIPKGHGLVIDADDPRAWPELEAAGLPETFRIESPTPGHGHAYAWADADMATIPGSFEWGEIRRSSSDARTSSMVLGPYALRSDGVYEPHNGCRTIATLPDSVIEYLRESSRRKSQSYTAAQSPADPGWYIEHGRHEWLVNRARKLRGDSLSGERLYDELVRIDRDRHRPPLADIGRGNEIREIADWANFHIEDDPPGITINTSPVVDHLAAEPDADPWPDLPAGLLFHGVLGDIALAVEPYTEADPIGVLGTLLVMFGAACGDGRALYQGSLQRSNLSVLLVGETGFRGRKGTGLDLARSVFHLAYPELAGLWLVGAASGEAITGHLGRHEGEERVLLVEPEFGRLLTIMNREGSTLSAVLRNAWDGVPLGHARARDESLVIRHHVSMLGHITPIELRSKLTDTDSANGFANRILFLAVRRRRLIAFPEAPDALVAAFVEPLHRAIVEARRPGEMRFDDAARDRWEWFYAELAATPRLGLAGGVTGRHEAQVARLSLVYALADRSPVVGLAHLEAAIALADYARRSAVWALGDSTGNRHADVLRRMLADGPLGWKEARGELGLRSAADMADAVAVLVAAGVAEIVKVRREGPAGRPRQVLRLVEAKDAKGAKDARGARTEEQGFTT